MEFYIRLESFIAFFSRINTIYLSTKNQKNQFNLPTAKHNRNICANHFDDQCNDTYSIVQWKKSL